MSRRDVNCPHCGYPLVHARTMTTGGLRLTPQKGTIASDTEEAGVVAVRCNNCVKWWPLANAKIVIYLDSDTITNQVPESA